MIKIRTEYLKMNKKHFLDKIFFPNKSIIGNRYLIVPLNEYDILSENFQIENNNAIIPISKNTRLEYWMSPGIYEETVEDFISLMESESSKIIQSFIQRYTYQKEIKLILNKRKKDLNDFEKIIKEILEIDEDCIVVTLSIPKKYFSIKENIQYQENNNYYYVTIPKQFPSFYKKEEIYNELSIIDFIIKRKD